MEDETSSSEPLLAAVEAQNAAANGNGFCMDEERNMEARIPSLCCLRFRQSRLVRLCHAFQCAMLQRA